MKHVASSVQPEAVGVLLPLGDPAAPDLSPDRQQLLQKATIPV